MKETKAAVRVEATKGSFALDRGAVVTPSALYLQPHTNILILPRVE